MALYKNVADQKLAVYAYNKLTGDAKTGDASNITAQISLDGGASASTNDTHPTELDSTNHPGTYLFDLTQAETDADMIVVTASSSTTNIALRPVYAFTELKPAGPLTGGTVYVYKDDSTSTEVQTGVTNTSNFDSMTGISMLKIDTSDSFYEAGHDYSVILKGATVDGETVNRLICTFSIENRNSLSGTVDANIVELNGEAVSGSTVVSANVVQWKGETAPNMTGDAYARLGEPSGDNVASDILAVKTQTDNTITVLGDPSNGTLSADIADALNKIDEAALWLNTFDPIMAKLDTTFEESTGDLYRFTADALSQSPASEVDVTEIKRLLESKGE